MWGQLSDFYWNLIDILFPPRCSGCGRWGERLCNQCLGKVTRIEEPICWICGDPIKSSLQKVCRRCSSNERSFDQVRSWAHYHGPIQNAIQNLKYQKDVGLSNILAKPMISVIYEMDWEIDLITAVPMDEQKLIKRGYNQAALLAKPIAWEIGVSFNPEALSKPFPNRPQVGLSDEERSVNVLGVYFSVPEYVEGKTVLVVDDVVTTGATLNACSTALKESGALMVYGISLARSLRL